MEFFEKIPSFGRSSIVDSPIGKITDLGEQELYDAVKRLLKRARSSEFLSDSEKIRRLVACVNFADAIRRSNVTSLILEEISHWDLHNALQSVEMRRFLRSHGNHSWEKIGLCAQSVVACILSNVQGSDELWVTLAAHQLGKSKTHILDYLKRGNDSILLANLLLANLIHITHKIFHALKYNEEMAASAPILRSLSQFDIRNTAPELQSSFFGLWHDIEHTLRDSVPQEIRDILLHLYNALRVAQGTNDALTRPSIVSPSAIHEAAERQPSTATVSSLSTGGRGRYGTSRSVVSPLPLQQQATLANTQSRKQPKVWSIDTFIPQSQPQSQPVQVERPPPFPPPEGAPVFRPHITGTAPPHRALRRSGPERSKSNEIVTPSYPPPTRYFG